MFYYLWLVGIALTSILSLSITISSNLKRRQPLVLPSYARSYFDNEKLEAMLSYQNEYDTYYLVYTVLQFIVSVILIVSGFYPFLFYKIAIASTFFHVLVFLLLSSLPSALFSFPFSLYKTFKIEKKHGFSTITFKLYLTDMLKNWLIELPLSFAVISAIYFFVGAFPLAWPIITTVALIIFSLLINIIYPTWIAPLFNKFTPLEEGELKTAIKTLFDKVGFKLDAIFVVDSSKRSKHSNAYFTGFGKKKRIVLYDNLIKQLSTEELVAVICHELGHFKKKHIIKRLIKISLLYLVLFQLIAYLTKLPSLYSSFGFKVEHLFIGLFLLELVFSSYFSLFSFISNFSSRKDEREADSYAKALLGSGEALATSLLILNRENLSDINPSKLEIFFDYSHPTLFQRCDSLLEVEK